jgi:hypothetical protein
MGDLTGISIETFRGDFEALEKMALASWREEYGAASFPNFYRPAFLHYLKYDFSLLTLEKGHGSMMLMRKMAASGQPMHFVKKIRVIARTLNLARVNASESPGNDGPG